MRIERRGAFVKEIEKVWEGTEEVAKSQLKMLFWGC